MTLDELHALADKFFEWPEGSGRQTVTTFSALLLTKHVLEMHEKAHSVQLAHLHLRDVAQRQLDALAGYRREVGLLTGVPDDQPCDAEVAARAALEQERAEPVQEPVGWRIRAVGSMGWRGPWRAYWQSARPGVNEPEFCEFEALYTAPPPCPTAELRAVAAEREACALVAEDWDSDSADPRDIAAAIRARGAS